MHANWHTAHASFQRQGNGSARPIFGVNALATLLRCSAILWRAWIIRAALNPGGYSEGVARKAVIAKNPSRRQIGGRTRLLGLKTFAASLDRRVSR
jgi:hypothetical protein